MRSSAASIWVGLLRAHNGDMFEARLSVCAVPVENSCVITAGLDHGPPKSHGLTQLTGGRSLVNWSVIGSALNGPVRTDIYPHKPVLPNKQDLRSTPESVLIGSRFRYGRRQAGLSQRRVSERSGVSQSLISRFERGMAPGMAAQRIVDIAMALGPGFPFGCCPHPHRCAWPSCSQAPPITHMFSEGGVGVGGQTSSHGQARRLASWLRRGPPQ